MQPLDVVGVRLEMPSNQPVVLLRESGTSRYLPIWIGTVEATAIAFAQEGVTPPRPLTHDLITNMLEALGEQIQDVRITHLDDGVFYATVTFVSGREVSARPSEPTADRLDGMATHAAMYRMSPLPPSRVATTNATFTRVGSTR